MSSSSFAAFTEPESEGSSWSFAANDEMVHWMYGKILTHLVTRFGSLDASGKAGWKAVDSELKPLDEKTTKLKGAGFIVPGEPPPLSLAFRPRACAERVSPSTVVGEGDSLVTASTILKKLKSPNADGAYKDLKTAAREANPKTSKKQRATPY